SHKDLRAPGSNGVRAVVTRASCPAPSRKVLWSCTRKRILARLRTRSDPPTPDLRDRARSRVECLCPKRRTTLPFGLRLGALRRRSCRLPSQTCRRAIATTGARGNRDEEWGDHPTDSPHSGSTIVVCQRVPSATGTRPDCPVRVPLASRFVATERRGPNEFLFVAKSCFVHALMRADGGSRL